MNNMNNNMMGGHTSIVGLVISIIVFLIVVKIIVSFAIMHQQKREENSEVKLKKHLKNYKDSGLSDSDIKLFRETMAEAKGYIMSWDKSIKKITELSVIEDVTGGVEAAKKTFQYIVENPSELTQQNDFLYKDLPNMLKLITSYEKLEAESVKNDKDLSEALLLIKTLSSRMAENYHKVLMKDVKIISKEVSNG
ncbi:MAG: 5-bromo-4-chloroindolyl phosphate hydrolysis family protein [Streptococcaceae bacterium]|jgi:5-bromo-4-chloroindolyl phosphate hydrolysis protein|nr:5-bromo-4-chloroindolyl phosphate hydrolysis family protein [Streptococcaceae bacterium]